MDACLTVPVLSAPDVRLRPFRREDASWVYYVSLDPQLRRRLSLPDPYYRSHARYFVDQVALRLHVTAREPTSRSSTGTPRPDLADQLACASESNDNEADHGRSGRTRPGRMARQDV